MQEGANQATAFHGWTEVTLGDPVWDLKIGSGAIATVAISSVRSRRTYALIRSIRTFTQGLRTAWLIIAEPQGWAYPTHTSSLPEARDF